MKASQVGKEVPAENGESDVLFGDQQAADFASEVYNKPVSVDQITYWRIAKKIHPPRKFGHHNIYDKPVLREDLRGKLAT